VAEHPHFDSITAGEAMHHVVLRWGFYNIVHRLLSGSTIFQDSDTHRLSGEIAKMKFSTVASSLVLAVSAFAQTTPSGFTPATNATLDVYYGTQYISPGLLVKKSSTSTLYRKKSTILTIDSHAKGSCHRAY
jgi:hypothetical protein